MEASVGHYGRAWVVVRSVKYNCEVCRRVCYGVLYTGFTNDRDFTRGDARAASSYLPKDGNQRTRTTDRVRGDALWGREMRRVGRQVEGA